MRPAAASEAQPVQHRVATNPCALNNKQEALAFGSPTAGLYGNGTGRIYCTDDAGAHWRLA